MTASSSSMVMMADGAELLPMVVRPAGHRERSGPVLSGPGQPHASSPIHGFLAQYAGSGPASACPPLPPEPASEVPPPAWPPPPPSAPAEPAAPLAPFDP